MAAIEDRPFDVPAAIKEIEDLVDSLYLGPSTGCIVDAARERRIPSNRLSEGNLVQLGYGNKQRRIWTAETDSTSAIGEGISRDKDLTKTLLAACGVPVPEGRMVDSASDAWKAAQDIGVPVVVKPTTAIMHAVYSPTSQPKLKLKKHMRTLSKKVAASWLKDTSQAMSTVF